MPEHVLVTGGYGFIGRSIVHSLIQCGNRVRVLDSLVEQVHGDRDDHRKFSEDVELIVGDIRDSDTVRAAIKGVDSIVHLAAEVGVGQSMYAIERYTSVNDLGTAVLFQQLIEHPVRRIVVASSMSIYGEGLYQSADGRLIETAERQPRAASGSWDPLDDKGRPLRPVPTPENKRPALASVYAIGKYVQERLTLTLAPAYGMEGTALRLWNVYGPGQALSNPYTGALAIFASRLMNDQPPLIFEDGEQKRDFVHVDDVARAFLLALDLPSAAGGVFNIASGQTRTISEVATLLAKAMGKDIAPEITNRTRAGDIRHCLPDITKAESVLGYAPCADFSLGLAGLAEWVADQTAFDRVEQARNELELRGLVA